MFMDERIEELKRQLNEILKQEEHEYSGGIIKKAPGIYFIYDKRQDDIAKEELKVLERGFEMGKLRIKTRAETYER